FKTHLIHVRQRRELREHPDLALRGLYFSLAETYLNPPPPELHNTDGDRLEPRTLYFDVDSTQAAFDALAPLAIGSTAMSCSRTGNSIAMGCWSRLWSRGSSGRMGSARVWRRCSWEEFSS